MTASSASGGVRLSRRQLVDWLRLIRAENVGPATFRTLLNHYGSAAAALEALPELARRGGGARTPRIPTPEEAERELDRTLAAGARLVALGEEDYPPRLREIPAPPPLLAVRGDGECLRRPAVAIVGSRNASLPGLKMAERIARGLGERGYVVVSGLARGIDGTAHKAALGSGTVAVIAGGIDHIYPEEHRPLQDDILRNGGAVLTEMPFGWIPRAQDFPRRNRLVSGISLGVVVVEATAKSGTLHTVRFALEQSRDVFAVPGSPLDPRAEGTNKLIRDGARLVTSAADIVEELEPLLRRLPDRPADSGLMDPDDAGEDIGQIDDDARALVLDALGPVPMAVDDILLHTGLSPRVVNIILVELTLAGRVERHGSQLVALTF
ncbi:DNA-processing protein DprA [Mongoliimonas terrestris]|uniref:DNA-processing protein DprA n=1 Tax=Mongoliimonas terrestris TaxID=1709001 RepID=UPI0009497A46|nr:DNA-processing protein DprA [Mongoliimonas terrestris]